MPDQPPARFTTLELVVYELATSVGRIRGLTKRRELEAIHIGGRPLWRLERSKFEGGVGRRPRITPCLSGALSAAEECVDR